MNENLKKMLTDVPLGVVSTSGPTGPESAALYYGFGDDLAIYFNTEVETRKFKNIQNNTKVSFVVYQQHPAMTLQLEGTAEKISEISKVTEIYDTLLRRTVAQGSVPPIMQIENGETALIKITPTWARFGDFSHGTTLAPGTIEMVVGK